MKGDETTTFDGTITQTLMMFNGDLIQRATKAEPGSFLHRIASDTRQRPTDKVQQLFLAALSRRSDATRNQGLAAVVCLPPAGSNEGLAGHLVGAAQQ